MGRGVEGEEAIGREKERERELKKMKEQRRSYR